MTILYTLSQLKSGQLAGITHLSLSDNLTEFPKEILLLADTLEVLDLSNNKLISLPKELKQLKKLKILFASNNLFTTLPEALGPCENLEMVGFKANKINSVPANSLPLKLRWLILTDNQLTTLPDTLGQRPRLQKLALAGNRLTELPQSFGLLHNLELLRISANELTSYPNQLLTLPKLAWITFSGNPFSRSDVQVKSVPQVSSASFKLLNILGQGASGVISKAVWYDKQDVFPDEVAVKIFKGALTSDGYPEDELKACLKVGTHPNLVQSLAQVNEKNCLALVMALIPEHFSNLGLPPTFASCTRDTFTQDFTLSIEQIAKVISQMQAVFNHLLKKQVCHGDLYAHNTLLDQNANIIFGDFGAASMYHMLNDTQQAHIQQIEKRALKIFITDLLSICAENDQDSIQYQSLSLLAG
jgi:hypothetical protein